MTYDPESNIHIRDKVKVVLDLSNYSTKKELKDDKWVDTSNLAAKRDFIAFKAEVDKLNINILVSFPNDLNKSSTNVDDLDFDKLKRVHVDLKKVSDVVSKEVVKTQNSTN